MAWLWTAASLLVTLTSLGLNWRSHRRSSRRRELWFDVRAEEFEPCGAALSLQDEIDVALDAGGGPPDSLHAVTLTVWVSSDRDVTSAEFDQGKSLNLSLGVPVVGQLESIEAEGADLTAPVLDKSGVLELQPCLLKGGSGYKLRFVTDGAPAPRTSQNPLVDVDVIWFQAEIRSIFGAQLRGHRWSLLPGVLGVALTLVVAVLEAGNGAAILEPAWAYTVPITILLASGGLLSVGAILLPTRVDRAVKAVPRPFGDGQARVWRSRLRTGPAPSR